MIMLANWLWRGDPSAAWLCILLKWWEWAAHGIESVCHQLQWTKKCIEIRCTVIGGRETWKGAGRARNMVAIVNHRDGCAKPVHSDVRWDCDEETNKHTSPCATHSRVHHTPKSKISIVMKVAEEFLQRAKAQRLRAEQSFSAEVLKNNVFWRWARTRINRFFIIQWRVIERKMYESGLRWVWDKLMGNIHD